MNGQGRSLLQCVVDDILSCQSFGNPLQPLSLTESLSVYKCLYSLNYGAHFASFADELIERLRDIQMNIN